MRMGLRGKRHIWVYPLIPHFTYKLGGMIQDKKVFDCAVCMGRGGLCIKVGKIVQEFYLELTSRFELNSL